MIKLILILFFKLLIGHAIADFALQSDSMAKGKNRNIEPENIPPGQKKTNCWFYWLTAHALIHSGFVFFILGGRYALIELILHWIYDFSKCENFLTIHEDQFGHIVAKIVYVFFFVIFG